MIPAGTYKVKANGTGVRFGALKEDGAECMVIPITVIEGEQEGTALEWIGFLSEKAIDRTIRTLRHMGWTGGKSGNSLVDTSGLGSTDVNAWVRHEEFTDRDGNKRTDVKVGILLPGDGQKRLAKTIEGSALEAYARRMEGIIANLGKPDATPRPAPAKASNGGSARTRKAEEPPPGRFEEDDIPFITDMTLSDRLVP